MFPTRQVFTTALMALALAACAGRNRAEPPANPDDYTTVQVENDNFQDMRVYVRPGFGGQRIRLGTALGKQITRFKIPKTIVVGITQLAFEIDPIGGGGKSLSETITVNPGEEIVLRIPPL